MSIKNDLMYPFGDPLADTFTEQNLVALNNVLNLAKERLWIADGRPGGLQFSDFDDLLSENDLATAKHSTEIVEQLIVQIRQHKNG